VLLWRIGRERERMRVKPPTPKGGSFVVKEMFLFLRGEVLRPAASG
jgi:hypothetical protein